MPKNAIFTSKEIAFFRALKKRKVPFLIVGLSAATLQGAPVVTQDVDLWIKNLGSDDFRKAVGDVGGV